MAPVTVGVLHPGAMGAAVGAALRTSGHAVLWAADGRSDATSHRAELADLIAVRTVADLVRCSDAVISLCPPQAATAVAGEVAAAGPPELYIDANAVAPSTVEAIADLVGPERVVDAAVVGPPPWRPGTTLVCLSGPRAAEAAALFAGTTLEVRVVGERLGAASAVQVCWGLQRAAVPAIWALISACAQRYGVATAVREVLAADAVDLDGRLERLAGRASTRAAQRAGDLAEAARALADVALPAGAAEAAAEVYRRVAAGLPRDAPATGQAWTEAVAGYRTAG